MKFLVELRTTQWKWIEADSEQEAERQLDEWERKTKKMHPVRMDLNVQVTTAIIEKK